MIKHLFLFALAWFAFAGSVCAQDSEPQLISAPAFTISAEDEAAGINGTIKVAADINAAGDVVRASVYVGPEWPCEAKFDERARRVMRDAENAVLKFRFKPAVRNGKPVDSRAGVSLTVGRSAKKKIEPVDPIAPKMINGGVVNGKAISLPKPRFPSQAKAAGAAGTVSVQVLVSEEGKVLTAQAINGSPYFHAASREAACSAKFAPTKLAGKPVKVSGVITYNFIP
jgi:TonB family protein